MSNTPLINPVNGSPVFGNLADMRSGPILLPGGEIHLPRGKHVGPNRGFGAVHIWYEHQIEMRKVGLFVEADVPAYVASIIQVGTPVYFEANNIRRTRLMAVKSRAGTAILELRNQRSGSIWSVVTAYSGTKTHGTRVGAVR